jgi:hypothetical protein
MAVLARPARHEGCETEIVDSDQIPLAGRPGYFIAWGGEAETPSI